MFKKSFRGYNPKSVNQAIITRKNQIDGEIEKQEKTIKAELKEQEKLSERFNTLTAKLEDARLNVMLIEKFQEYMHIFIDEARAYTEKKICTELKDAESYIHEINEQISVLDEKIAMIKQNIHSLVQDLSSRTKLADNKQFAKDNENLNDIIKSFETRMDIPKEAGIPMGKLLLKEDSRNLMQRLISIEEEGTNKESLELSEIAVTVDYEELNFTEQTILVVEDDKYTANLLEHMLEREGFKVIYAADGLKASEIVNEIISPRLVLLNIMLPYVDGLQLIKQIRNKPQWDDTPIIVLTANHSERDIVDVLNAGANDCIKKPFSAKELIARIRSLSGGGNN